MAAFCASTIAMPAEPVKPVSQASRSAWGGTYSPWCSSARGIAKPCNPSCASRPRSAATRTADLSDCPAELMVGARHCRGAGRARNKGLRYAIFAWWIGVTVDCAGFGAPHVTGRTTAFLLRRILRYASIQIDPDRHGFRRTGGAPAGRRPARPVFPFVFRQRMERSAAAILPSRPARCCRRSRFPDSASAMVYRIVSR